MQLKTNDGWNRRICLHICDCTCNVKQSTGTREGSTVIQNLKNPILSIRHPSISHFGTRYRACCEVKYATMCMFVPWIHHTETFSLDLNDILVAFLYINLFHHLCYEIRLFISILLNSVCRPTTSVSESLQNITNVEKMNQLVNLIGEGHLLSCLTDNDLFNDIPQPSMIKRLGSRLVANISSVRGTSFLFSYSKLLSCLTMIFNLIVGLPTLSQHFYPPSFFAYTFIFSVSFFHGCQTAIISDRCSLSFHEIPQRICYMRW